MKIKNKSIYDKELDKAEKDFDKLRDKVAQRIKPLIERKVRSLNIPCMYTQHSMYRTDEGDPYAKRFEQLQDFCYKLSDYYRIQLYFEFTGGIFEWFIF